MSINFKKAFIAGVERIAAWVDLLDQINVFPIADGDTGRNLIISLSPLRQLDKNREKIIHSLLFSARGNAGNIAARFFAEFLNADSKNALPEAAKNGRDSAWKAVNDPKHGTMLTIFDALAEILEHNKDFDKHGVFNILNHLETVVSSTAEMLPRLKEANVVDAGALGMFLYMEGFFNTIENIDSYRNITKIFNDKLKISSSFYEKLEPGYCVDTTLQINEHSRDTIERLSDIGESVVMIHDRDYLKLHLHTTDKEEVRKKLESYGDVVQWSDDDLKTQIEGFRKSNKQQAIHIMTDAAGSVTREDAQNFGITLLDSYITIDKMCLPETHFNSTELYESMKKGIKVSTSQASVFESHQHYNSVINRYPRVLYLCVGSVFTGNYDVVMEWKKENDPDNRITVIDTCAASGRLGAVVIAAARYSHKSANPEDVIEFAHQALNDCREYIFLDRLHYLAKGGRLSKTSAFFGDMLRMKPVVTPTAEGAKKAGVVRNTRDQLDFLQKKINVTFSIVLRYIVSVRQFREFYNKHKDRFFAYLMRSTGDYYLASDIMQDSFTRYLERYG